MKEIALVSIIISEEHTKGFKKRKEQSRDKGKPGNIEAMKERVLYLAEIRIYFL